MSARAVATRPPGRALLRLAGVLTQIMSAGCLLLGTIALVLVQQNRMDGAGLVILWMAAALIGLVFGGLMGRGGLISLVLCAVLDATLGIVLLVIEYDALRAILKILPDPDVQNVADVVTGVGVALLVAFGLCLIAIPQALRYTRWMHAETEPRLASSTARGFPPPPISAARGSVWQLPLVAPEESRSRRRMYFALAGFAIGFGAGIGVLVSSSAQRTGGGAASLPSNGGSGPIAADPTPDAPGPATPVAEKGSADAGSGSDDAKAAVDARSPGSAGALVQTQRAALAKGDLAALGRTLAPGVFGFGVDADEVAEGRDAVELQLRKDLGELLRGGARVDIEFSNIADERDHAWIALDLEVAAPAKPVRRFMVTQLAARIGGAWAVVAWHWAVPVLDATAEKMAVMGTKPTPKPISGGLDGPKALEDAVRAAFGSKRGQAAARSDHPKSVNFGSSQRDKTKGADAVQKVFNRLPARIKIHDGVRAVAAGAWDPAQKAAPKVAFAALNVDFTEKTRAATDLTHTFRVLAVLVLEGNAWKIVQTHWSHGGPVR